MAVTNVKSKVSQEFLPIKEIRDDLVILKDGSLRMILMTSTVNFALKSSDEQTALILQYQNFLNSLDFSLQIFIQSRELNIEPYLEDLRKREKEQTNELLKTQMREYVGFVKEFVASTNIVHKNFYIVIPYATAGMEIKSGPLANVLAQFTGKTAAGSANLAQEKFEEHKIQLQQRADAVLDGLSRVGIRTAPLSTEELIELFFKLYNPSEMEATRLPEYAP